MKIKQLVILTILKYVFENIYTKKLNYMFDEKLFYIMWILILTTNTNNSKNNNNTNTNANKINY